ACQALAQGPGPTLRCRLRVRPLCPDRPGAGTEAVPVRRGDDNTQRGGRGRLFRRGRDEPGHGPRPAPRPRRLPPARPRPDGPRHAGRPIRPRQLKAIPDTFATGSFALPAAARWQALGGRAVTEPGGPGRSVTSRSAYRPVRGA